MKWLHPELGEVAPIKRAHQPAKVWKHLYDPAERWSDLITADPARLHDEAVDAGCPPFRPSKRLPDFHGRVRRLLERHHDEAYGPAYASELGHDETRWGPKLSDATRWVGRSPRCVIGIVAASPLVRVVTAYRPLPPLPGVGWSDEDFCRQADYVFEKETGLDPTSSQRLTDELRRVADVGAATTGDGWWLALAVARGRAAAATDPSLRAQLERAEQTLSSARGALRLQLVRSMPLEGLVDRLADGLKQSEPEDVEQALSDVEDALLVLDVLGADDEVTTLLDHTTSLMHWAPPEFAALAAQAPHRHGALAAGSAAAALWDAVEEAVAGASLRETTPNHRPQARLVDELVPAPRLLERIAAWAGARADAGRAWLDHQLDGLAVFEPVPVMGRGASTAPWFVQGEITVGSGSLRVFAVDEEYPEGYEVTDLATAPGAALWQLERRGQVVTFVVIRSDTPMSGSTLAELLTEAEGRDDVAIATRAISRPS